MVPSSVTRELIVEVVAPTDGPRQVAVAVHYDTGDPYAIRTVFRVALDEQVTWVFARELLSRGLDEACGDGDVRIWPVRHDGVTVVCIMLRSPDCEAVLHAGFDDLVEFLASAYTLCPRGCESQHLQIDRALGVLFAT